MQIHYPFHPRAGQRVEVLRRHRFKGTMMYVVRQPDGTLAQVPTWMFAPDAAAMTVTDRPRIAMGALRDLRSLLDTVLPSSSHMEPGEGYGTTRRPSGTAGAGAGTDAGDANGGAPAAGGAAARSDAGPSAEPAGRHGRIDGGK